MFSSSDSTYLTTSQVRALSSFKRAVARNEIYARHGYKFRYNKDMIRYFNSQSWYRNKGKSASQVEREFNKYERANIRLIRKVEKG